MRLGIEAPSGIPIYREEIWQAVRDENRAAGGSGEDEDSDAVSPRPSGDGGPDDS